ncbi:MAG: hypothetical protein JSS02_23480, partial [Planctomycetes bacterium]|nr:hypothetical protein [Planctomycetota bacterium]
MNEPSPLDHGSSAPLPENSATANEESIEVTLRLDGPHSQPGGPAPHAERLETAAVRNFPAREIPLESMGGLDVAAESAVTTSAPPPRNEAFRLQTETGQIAAYLKQQYADIERREARLHAQFAQSDQERRDQRLWINQVESQLAERERALAEKEDALATQVTTCEALDRELRELQETLLRERHAFDVERQEWERTRDEQIQVIEAMRAKQQIELDRLRAETLAELGAAETELKQKAVLLDNRHRFQQEHLQRLMQDFEIQQNEFRREEQMLRTQAEAERQQN